MEKGRIGSGVVPAYDTASNKLSFSIEATDYDCKEFRYNGWFAYGLWCWIEDETKYTMKGFAVALECDIMCMSYSYGYY